MNIFWYACAIITPAALLASLLYRYRRRTLRDAAIASEKITPALGVSAWPLTINIGILAPLANETTNHLMQGLTDLLALSSRTEYKIVPFFGDNTRVTLFNNAQEAAKTCDALITVGVTCANIAAEARETLNTMPIIKVCLREEQLSKLLPHSPHTIIVTTLYDYPQQVALLKQIKPSAHYLCIAYRQHNDNMRNEVEQLNKALVDASFKTDIQMISHHAHIDNQLSAFGREHDTLFIMPHAVTASNIQELITYCSNKKITLCTQEFDVVTLGAALGFGGYEKKLGSDIGHIIRNIFEGRKSYQAGTIIAHHPVYHCMINKNKSNAQGLDIDLEYLTILEQVHLFTTTPLTHQPHNNNNDTINQNI